jgi:ribosome-associated protein
VTPLKTANKKVPLEKKTKQVMDSREKVDLIAKATLEKKGHDLVLLSVAELTSIADYYLICSADSEPQVWAIVDAVEKALLKEKIKPLGIEGMRTASWVLVDYGDVILHIFKKEARTLYNLDSLWADAPKTLLSEQALPSAPQVSVRKKKVPV